MPWVNAPHHPRQPVELFDVRRLRLEQVDPPWIPAHHQLARDQAWDAAVKANPTGLFDGPAVAVAGFDQDDLGDIVLHWTPVTYRHYALRRVPGATALGSLFVAVVQPAAEGGLLVGRMSPLTAAPGRWQLPGGSAEPPPGHASLDESALRHHAARELGEETGVVIAPDDLSLWAVTRGEHGNIGVLYRAPLVPASELRRQFVSLVAAETACGRIPELDAITIVSTLEDVSGPSVDYLSPVLRHHQTRIRE